MASDLPFDAGDHLLPHGARRHQQAAVGSLVRIAGQGVEQVRNVGADIRVAGEIAEVRVDAAGHRVVIACPHVHVAADSVGFAAHHQAHLGVSLESQDAVDHVHALVLKCSRPGDIVLLVETRLQFEQHRHLLLVFPRLHERRHDGGVGTHPVERLP